MCEENRKNAATVFTHMGRIAFGGWAVGLMRPRRGGRPCWQTVKCTDVEGLRARIGDIQRQLSKSPEDVVLARGSFDFAGCEEQCHLLVRGDAGATAKGVRYIRFVEGRRLTAGELAFAVRTMHTALGL